MKAPGNYGCVEASYVKKVYDKGNVILVDSRPKKAKYDKGHLPGALSIPDKKFDKFKQLLPTGKNTPLIFYCQGYT
jgi:rhodanese-related sulfurtransferase